MEGRSGRARGAVRAARWVVPVVALTAIFYGVVQTSDPFSKSFPGLPGSFQAFESPGAVTVYAEPSPPPSPAPVQISPPPAEPATLAPSSPAAPPLSGGAEPTPPAAPTSVRPNRPSSGGATGGTNVGGGTGSRPTGPDRPVPTAGSPNSIQSGKHTQKPERAKSKGGHSGRQAGKAQKAEGQKKRDKDEGHKGKVDKDKGEKGKD